LGGLADGQVAYAGLDTGGAVERVDGEDPVQFCQTQHDTIGVGQGAARQAGAGTAGHHRRAVFAAGCEDGGDPVVIGW